MLSRPAVWGLHALMMFAGAWAILVRVGPAGLRGVVWAEDGQIFLTEAYRRGLGALLDPYAGYAHVLDRVLAAGIAGLPISTQGIAVNVAAAVAQVSLAFLAKAAVSAHARGPWAGWVLWLYIVLVPVGPETAANIANLQWFLLCVGCLAACWVPTTWFGRIASVITIALLTLSSPFGAVAVGVAFVGWLVTRSRFHMVLAAAGSAGAAIQAMVMLHAPARHVSHRLDPVLLARGYLDRVLGDGVAGLPGIASSYDLSPWHVIVPLGVAVVLVTGAAMARAQSLRIALSLCVLSIGTFAVPTLLGGTAVSNPYFSARYFVAPAVLLVAALVLLADGATAGSSRETTARVGQTAGWTGRAAVGGLAVLLAHALVVSYQGPRIYRKPTPDWNQGINTARGGCTGDEGAANVPIQPTGWFASVPCSLFDR